MKKNILFLIFIVIWGMPLGFIISSSGKKREGKATVISQIILLSEPRYDSQTSVEKALLKRRSIREYKSEALTLEEISQILWAAQGITNQEGFRTAPSAGALYPLEVYLVVGNVRGLSDGVYKYRPSGHRLVRILEGDKRGTLSVAALNQICIKEAPIDIVFSAVYKRTTIKYGKRGIRYVHMEVGHAAQNVYLEAVSLNLGTVTIGAFHDNIVKKVLNMPKEEHPLYIMPVGRK